MKCNSCGRFVKVIGQNLAQYYVMCSNCGQSITERPIIETAEQANQLCLDLWAQIIKDIKKEKHTKAYLDYYKFNVETLKEKIIGEYNWQDGCPLCEFYINCKNCPMKKCWELGYADYMTFKQIKEFYKNIQLELIRGGIK
jgi:hypothetical protein